MDQHGGKHLAVQALECSAFDGHYTYIACEPFTTSPPVPITNQAQAIRYLTQFLTHAMYGVGPCSDAAGGPGPSVGQGPSSKRCRPQSGKFTHRPAAVQKGDARLDDLTSGLHESCTVVDADGHLAGVHLAAEDLQYVRYKCGAAHRYVFLCCFVLDWCVMECVCIIHCVCIQQHAPTICQLAETK